jgi:hypothetical protein
MMAGLFRKSKRQSDAFHAQRIPASNHQSGCVWDVWMDAMTMARRTLREYGDNAEAECDARAQYHDMNGCPAVAEQWRRLKRTVRLARQPDRQE